MSEEQQGHGKRNGVLIIVTALFILGAYLLFVPNVVLGSINPTTSQAISWSYPANRYGITQTTCVFPGGGQNFIVPNINLQTLANFGVYGPSPGTCYNIPAGVPAFNSGMYQAVCPPMTFTGAVGGQGGATLQDCSYTVIMTAGAITTTSTSSTCYSYQLRPSGSCSGS